jgi:outer membrane protein OmpA-like peptidoglycan-associated protein
VTTTSDQSHSSQAAPTNAGAARPADRQTFEGRLRATAVLSLLVSLFGLGVLTVYAVEKVRADADARLEAAGAAGGRAGEARADAVADLGLPPAPTPDEPMTERPQDSAAPPGDPRESAPQTPTQALADQFESNDAALRQALIDAERLRATRDALQTALKAAVNAAQPAKVLAQSAGAPGADAVSEPFCPDLNAMLRGYAKVGACFTDAGLRVSLGADDLRFPVGSAELPTDAADSMLASVAQILEREPQQRLAVIGHTDASGDTARNQVLSEQRASAIRDALIALGIEPARIRAEGRGETLPIADNDTAAGRLANRRVELILTTPLQPD